MVINGKNKMHKAIKAIAIAVTALSFATATAVHAQNQQWVQITTTENGYRFFFDAASQVRLFDVGVKQNTFYTLALTTTTGIRSFKQRYQADCFKGTLALYGLELVNAQGSLIRSIPLSSVDRDPFIPTKDTITLDIWRYACTQF